MAAAAVTGATDVVEDAAAAVQGAAPAAAAAGAAAGPVAAVAAPEPAIPRRVQVDADAVAQACQASQAAPGTSPRHIAWPGQGPVRRVRSEGPRVRLVVRSPDRGRACRDDAQDQAWRQGVDQRVPRQTGDQE